MPVIATSPKHLSEVIGGTFEFSDHLGVAFCYAQVNVEGTTAIEPLGTPLIWNNTNESFEVYVDQDIAAVTTTGGSPLPGGHVICLSMGAHQGIGFSEGDVQLQAAVNTIFTVLYRGPAAIKTAGVEWGTADATAQAAFLARFEEQLITNITTATAIVPSYVS